MFRKLLPVLLLCIGIAGGLGAGIALRPTSDAAAHTETDTPRKKEQAPERHKAPASDGHDVQDGTDKEYVKLNNQFIIPILRSDVVASLVVLSLSIEVDASQTELIYSREPKLRDAFLQVLFDHANMGGFNGEFTNATTMDILRMSLTEVAQSTIGNAVSNVLITEIARQDS